MLGPELIQDALDKVKLIRQRLQPAKSRQKSYADKRKRQLEFQVGEQVLLKVSPAKGVIRFRLRGKLNPRYVGPFEILERIGIWHTGWHYLLAWMKFIMCFTCLC